VAAGGKLSSTYMSTSQHNMAIPAFPDSAITFKCFNTPPVVENILQMHLSSYFLAKERILMGCQHCWSSLFGFW